MDFELQEDGTVTTPSPQDELRDILEDFLMKVKYQDVPGVWISDSEKHDINLAKEAIQSYLDTKVREAKVDENEYWHELSKIFQRGMLPVDFKDRISELTQEQTR